MGCDGKTRARFPALNLVVSLKENKKEMKCISRSPKTRLTITLMLTIVIGVFSSLFATEITPDGKVEWSLTFKTFSFWVLVLLSIVWLWVHIKFMEYDNSILAFADDEYCKAYMRKTELEAYAANIKDNPSQVSIFKLSEFKSKLEGDNK